MRSLLIVDDDPVMVRNIVQGFRLEDLAAEGTTNIHETISLIEKKRPDAVILDVCWGKSDRTEGIEVLKQIRRRWQKAELPVVMMSGKSEAREHDEAMDSGADLFIAKPFEMAEMVEDVLRLLNGGSSPPEPELEPWEERIVGCSREMLNMASHIYRFAEERSNVLITGETGTGKDLVARMYHKRSQSWGEKDLQVIYLTEISPGLIESELFGHKKGAFTNADENRVGLLEVANHGIVLLNEIGDLPLAQQVKLLNLIENKIITPMGTSHKQELDVVILAATNRDLQKMIDQGEFRADLYQRLNVARIAIPPLRDHLEDVPQLVENFRKKYNRKAAVPVTEVEKEVIDYFKTLFWKENVRQLEHCFLDAARKCIRGKVVMRDAAGFIEREKIRPVGVTEGEYPETFNFEVDYHTFSDKFLKQSRRDYVVHHLNKHGWHVPTTAEAIGIRRQQLNEIIRTLGIKKQ